MSDHPSSHDPGTRPPPHPVRPDRTGAPTPVRLAVDAPASAEEPAPVVRAVTSRDGAAWTAEVGGRSRMGRRGEIGVPVLLLLFRPEASADGADPTHEALVVGETLAHFSDERLAAILDEAEPYTPLPDPLSEPARRRSGRHRRS